METYGAKAPGKVLWLGGYSILERPNVGFVTAIDAYVHAKARLFANSDIVKVKVPDFGINISGTIDAHNGHVAINGPKEAQIVLSAIKVALAYAYSKGAKLSGLELSTKNDDAFATIISNEASEQRISKSGMGSSSAVTVATIASILSAYDLDFYENDALHKLSQLSYSIASGKIGSGFDIAAAVYGSIKYTRYSHSILKDFPAQFTPDDVHKIVSRGWDYNISKVKLPNMYEATTANFIGKAAMTVPMVSRVNEFKKANPEAYNDLISRMNSTALKAIDCLSKISDGSAGYDDELELVNHFVENRILTKKLGVMSNTDIEPDEVTSLIEDSMKHGALVAKLPGAGGKDSIVALSKGKQGAQRLKKFWNATAGLQLLDIKMVENGVISGY